MELPLIKSHLRVDHDFEDSLILEYQSWAEEEVKDSVSTEPLRNEEFFTNSPHFNRAVMMLVAYYFENRLGYTEKTIDNAPNTVLSAVQKLRGNYESVVVV